ncbi:hypothetical protein EDD85DRAFT_953350 [Armillaria nabsnona]|nr:hypothetical protein EDD85DRAFT_953350 [Armillaria nabsnona]
MHLHFVVELLGGADNWEQCTCNADGTLKQASDIEWINDPDDDTSATGPSGPVGHELHGHGLHNRSNTKFSAYIAVEKLDEDGNPVAPPKPCKHSSKYTDNTDGTSEASNNSDGDVGITNEELADSLPSKTIPVTGEETLCMQARNATVSKTLITPHPTLHTQTLKFLGGYYAIEAD